MNDAERNPSSPSRIAIGIVIKFAKMNALYASLPSDIAPMNATIHIHRSVTGKNIPPLASLLIHLKIVSKSLVSFTPGVG